VQVAGDAPGALIQMRQVRPDVLLLDPVVPHSRPLVAHCRRDPRLRGMRLLLLSREPSLGQAVEELRARAGLVKPIDLDVLLAVVTRTARCGAQCVARIPADHREHYMTTRPVARAQAEGSHCQLALERAASRRGPGRPRPRVVSTCPHQAGI
jgi:DNA-binding response OmpR family regulator